MSSAENILTIGDDGKIAADIFERVRANENEWRPPV